MAVIFGDNLKEVRTEKNLSQGDLAEMLGVHPTQLSRYERNLSSPSLELIVKLANALEVPTDRLIYGSKEQKVKTQLKDTELLNLFSKVQSLNKAEQECVKTFLKAFTIQKDLQKQLA
jgi:transcriptional regulator with XRE-family HTH domain